jgi:1-acyl-sn-glycerol-3-phosphate acyltransferase
MLLNCQALRDTDFLGRFVELVGKYTFIVAQDQDYLNVLCRDKVCYLPIAWDVEASSDISIPEGEIMLIHFNMTAKPWKYEDCKLGGYFWEYAKKVSVYDELCRVREGITDKVRQMEEESKKKLFAICEHEIAKGDNYLKIRGKVKSQSRIDIIEKIAKLEREGRFDEDVEEDPTGCGLKPEDIDYLSEKYLARVKRGITYYMARKFMNRLIAKKQLIIKEIKGIENFDSLESGAVITCNHFNAMDSFVTQIAYEASRHVRQYSRKRKLYRIIKEGNYTSFKGFYGVIMRNCNTLPLSSNTKTMRRFMEAVDKVLSDGHFALIYPEQSMWWNYKKPKPLKRGGFIFAARSNVPVLPIFITMEDSDILDKDGFYVQEYTINIAPPIYPNPKLSQRRNSEYMLAQNARIWKEIYEQSYGVELEYATSATAEDMSEDMSEDTSEDSIVFVDFSQ